LVKRGKYLNISPLSKDSFQLFRELIYKETSINMKEHKKILVSNRLRKRLVALGIDNYNDYYNYLIDKKNRRNCF